MIKKYQRIIAIVIICAILGGCSTTTAPIGSTTDQNTPATQASTTFPESTTEESTILTEATIPSATEETEAPTDGTTVIPTTEPLTVPTTEPTVIPTTKPTTIPATEPTKEAATTQATETHVVPPTEVTTLPPTESTTIPTTEATEPPHLHSFSEATCTLPKTCDCGATEGNALGHNWLLATCLKPEVCSVCGATTGSAKGHSFINGCCSACGVNDPAFSVSGTVWVTAKGKRYHNNPKCSNMKNPEEVTIEEAEKRGLTPCQKCY